MSPNDPAAAGDPAPPAVDSLQFRRAETVPSTAPGRQCAACRQPISGEYFHAQGQPVCPLCAERIQSGQQSPPHISLAKAALFGAGAALAGSALYALVAIVTGLEIGIIAIVVGIMVGKAVRYGSQGLGGRPQQILAVVLTYFAITSGYIPVFIYQAVKESKAASNKTEPAKTQSGDGQMTLGKALVSMLVLAAAAPFLGLASEPLQGLIGLFIIYIGLSRAWSLTGRSDILILGPYQPET